MNRRIVFLVTLAFCGLAGRHSVPRAGAAEAFPVVADGEARAVVVRNTEGGPVTRLAADELLDHVEAMTGVRLPEADAETWDRAVPAIILGRGALLDELGLEWDEPPPEGFRTAALAGRPVLVIAGRDVGTPWGTAHPMNQHREFGTLYGVYDLLESWGIRWLFPGDLGTVIPSRATLHAPRVDRMDWPDFPRRNLWTRAEEPRTAFQESGAPQRAARLHALRSRSGNSTFEYSSGHHRPNWWTLWAESNPEFLGLFRGDRGWRRIAPGTGADRMPTRSKPCVSNPAVAAAVAEQAVNAFRGETRAYSICEADGSGGFCTCSGCVALDELDEGEAPYGFSPEGIYSDLASARVNLSDRYVTFWNRVAEQVDAAIPDLTDRYLGVYLYTYYSNVPRREQQLHPRLRAVYVNNGQVDPAELQRRLAGWRRMTPHPITMYIPPMFGAWPLRDYAQVTLPVLTLGNVHEGMLFCRETGINGTLLNPNFTANNVGSHGVLAYAYSRWLWDADRTPEEILNDFTRHAFGPAAKPMLAFFRAIEERQNRFPIPGVAHEGAGFDAWISHHLDVFTDGFVDELRGHIETALAQAAAESERERVLVFGQNLEFTAAQLGLERAWRAFAAGETAIGPVLAAYRACEELLSDLRPENRPDRPLFRRSAASHAVALSEQYEPLGLLDPAAWEMKADPYGEGVVQRWFAGGGDAAAWRPVRMDLGYDLQGLHGSALRVWYRTRFEMPAEADPARLRLAFRANNTSGELYLNGHRIGQQILGEGAYVEPELDGAGHLVAAATAGAPYVYDISRALRPGQSNELVVVFWGFADRGVGFHPAWLLAEH